MHRNLRETEDISDKNIVVDEMTFNVNSCHKSGLKGVSVL